MDPKVWVILGFLLVASLTSGITQALAKAANATKTAKKELGCGILILALLSIPFAVIAGGWADMILWNMVAPQFGFPQIDIITAIGLSLLLQSLFRGTGPVPVRIYKPDFE